MVDLLQRALAPAHRGRPAAEHEHRRVVLLGGGERAHPVRHARPGGERAHAGLARDLRPALRGEGGGLLVADVDELDALAPAAVVEGEQMPAGEGEELPDAVRLEPPGDQAPAVQRLRLLCRLRHGARTLSACGAGRRGRGGEYPPDRGVCRAPRRAAAARANSVVRHGAHPGHAHAAADLDLLLAELDRERTAPRLPAPRREPPADGGRVRRTDPRRARLALTRGT